MEFSSAKFGHFSGIFGRLGALSGLADGLNSEPKTAQKVAPAALAAARALRLPQGSAAGVGAELKADHNHASLIKSVEVKTVLAATTGGDNAMSTRPLSLRIERYLAPEGLDEAQRFLWIWPDEVEPEAELLDALNSRLRELHAALLQLGGEDKGESCWVVYPADLLESEEDAAALPALSELSRDEFAVFELAIALGVYGLMRWQKHHNRPNWAAFGALSRPGDAPGELGTLEPAILKVSALLERAAALNKAGFGGKIIYSAANHSEADQDDISRALGRTGAPLWSLADALIHLGWDLPHSIPHPAPYARWCKEQNTIRFDEIFKAERYRINELFKNSRSDAGEHHIRDFILDSNASVYLVSREPGIDKIRWLQSRAYSLSKLQPKTRDLDSIKLHDPAVLYAHVDEFLASQGEAAVHPFGDSPEGMNKFRALLAQGTPIYWFIDALDTLARPAEFIEQHIIPYLDASREVAGEGPGPLRIILTGQKRTFEALSYKSTLRGYIDEEEEGIYEWLTLDDYTGRFSGSSYDMQDWRDHGGPLNEWRDFSHRAQALLSSPSILSLFYNLYRDQEAPAHIRLDELLRDAMLDSLVIIIKRWRYTGEVSTEVSDSRLNEELDILLSKMALAHCQAHHTGREIVFDAAELPQMEAEGRLARDYKTLPQLNAEQAERALRLAIEARLLRARQRGGRTFVSFARSEWLSYFLYFAYAEYIPEHFPRSEGIDNLHRLNSPSDFGELAVELLATELLESDEFEDWSDLAVSLFGHWTWGPLMRAWVALRDNSPATVQANLIAAAERWVEEVDLDRAIYMHKHISQAFWAVRGTRDRDTDTAGLYFWIPLLRMHTRVAPFEVDPRKGEAPHLMRDNTWRESVEAAFMQNRASAELLHSAINNQRCIHDYDVEEPDAYTVESLHFELLRAKLGIYNDDQSAANLWHRDEISSDDVARLDSVAAILYRLGDEIEHQSTSLSSLDLKLAKISIEQLKAGLSSPHAEQYSPTDEQCLESFKRSPYTYLKLASSTSDLAGHLFALGLPEHAEDLIEQAFSYYNAVRGELLRDKWRSETHMTKLNTRYWGTFVDFIRRVEVGTRANAEPAHGVAIMNRVLLFIREASLIRELIREGNLADWEVSFELIEEIYAYARALMVKGALMTKLDLEPEGTALKAKADRLLDFHSRFSRHVNHYHNAPRPLRYYGHFEETYAQLLTVYED